MKNQSTIGMSTPAANGKSTFGIKCLEEQFQGLHKYKDAMGPHATGADFANQILKGLPLTGLVIDDNDEIPEIAVAKRNFLGLIMEHTTTLLKLLDGFGVQWKHRLKEMEGRASDLAILENQIEASLEAKDREVADLSHRCESLASQNASLAGEKEKADKLIATLERQSLFFADQVKALNANIELTAQENAAQIDSIKTITDENLQLGRKLQEAEMKLTALQTTYERLKAEDRLQFQKQLAEQLEAERSKIEAKQDAHASEIKRLYDARIHDLETENSELKAEVKLRSSKVK